MRLFIMLVTFVGISTTAYADQKRPITPSLPEHVGTDLSGKRVIHNSQNPTKQQEEQNDFFSEDSMGHNKKNR